MSLRVSGWLVLGIAGLVACSDGAERPGTGDNEPPTLKSVRVTTLEDVPIELAVLDGVTDPEGDTVRVISANAPDHLAEVVDGTRIRVTPRREFHGEIFVSYKVNDQHNTLSGFAMVTVINFDDPPVAMAAELTVHRTAEIVLEGSDIDSTELSYEIVAPPANGTLTGTGAHQTYVAAAGFDGDDSFVYRVRDGAGASDPVLVRLHVLKGNIPTGSGFSLLGNEDQPLGVVLRATDFDLDPLTFTVVAPPQHGQLSGTAPNLTYTPAANYHGSDALTFTASDVDGVSAPISVAITVSSLNDVPVGLAQTLAATEDTARSITLVASDDDGDVLTFQASAPSHGTLTGTGATLTYTPAANYHGPDGFTFSARDGFATSIPVTVTINVAGTPDAPSAPPLAVALNEDTATALTLPGNDPDGDPITFAVLTQPAHGALSGTAPALVYTPAANYNGPDSFTYNVASLGETSATATVTLDVKPVNDQPVASDISVTTNEDTAIAIVLPATDVDGQALTFSLVSLPSDGVLSGTPPNLTYTPAHNANGPRSFLFRASDGSATSPQATATIQITPVNDPPATVDDYAFSERDGSVTFAVIGNDTDPEGDAVTLDSVAAPAHGDVDIVDGKLHYTPDAGFTGVELVTYTAVDAIGATATGVAHVGVGVFPAGAPLAFIALVGGSVSDADSTNAPAVSGDGRFVAVVSPLALLADDSNGKPDVYLFDRGTGAITRVSVALGGGGGTGASFRPQLTADAHYVVFESTSDNLVAGDTNGASDVFRFDRLTGTTIRISVGNGGGQASGETGDPEVSDDGNLVVFASTAFDLVASDVNGVQDVFVRNVTAGTTTRASVTASGGDGDLASTDPAISGDGRIVAFSSPSTNLVAGDINNVSDIFVRDLVAGTTTRVSVSSTGGEANGASLSPALSRDGKIIAFRSAARNLVGGTPVPGTQPVLYVRDVQQQLTTMPISNTGITTVRLSADGRYVTAEGFGIFIRDRLAGVTATPTGATSAWAWPVLSANGRYLVAIDAANRVVFATPNPL